MMIIEGADHLGKTTAAKRVVDIANDLANQIIDSDPEASPYPIRYQHMSRQNAGFDFLYDYRDIISMYAVQDRFHLGGLVWHDKVINAEELRLIESWLGALGSYTIIFYNSDEGEYRGWLEHQGKDEMFDIDTIMEANKKYFDMVCQTYRIPVQFDSSWDLAQGYPTDEVLQSWLTNWMKRLDLLPR